MTATTTSGRRSTAPEALNTPNALPLDAVTALTEALNKVLADTFALYLKTKNFHWHVSGPHFRDYHLLFDEQATEILAVTDGLAERVRKIGGATLRSIGNISRLQRVQDDDHAEIRVLSPVLKALTAQGAGLVVLDVGANLDARVAVVSNGGGPLAAAPGPGRAPRRRRLPPHPRPGRDRARRGPGGRRGVDALPARPGGLATVDLRLPVRGPPIEQVAPGRWKV